MAMRAVIRSIQEGFQNLAQYSKQANKDISTLKTSMQTLQNSFATAFAPILTAITPALQTLINHLSQAISVMGQFFAVLLTGATTFTKAKDAQVDYAKTLAKTAKEANKSLSPIDKLNNVVDSGEAGGYEAPGPQQMFEEVEIDNKLIDKVEEFKTLLEPVISAFDRLKVSVAPFAENVGSGLKWMYDNVLVPLGSWTISDLIPAFLDALGAGIGVLNSAIEIFKPYGLWLWENFLQPLATWTGEAVINGLNLLTTGLQSLSDWIANNQDLVINAAIFIGSFFAAFKIAEFMTVIAPFISTLAGMISSGTLLSTVLSGISTALGAIFSPVTLIAAALGLLIYTFIDLYKNSENFRQSIADLGATWMEALQPLADFVGTVLTDAWDKILKPIIDFFINTLLPNLIDTFKNLWENVLVPLGDFIGTVLQPVFQVLSDLLSMLWEKVILPLAEAVGGVLKKAWDGLYRILNKTIIPIIGKVIDVLKFLWEKVINPVINVLWKNLKPAFETVFSGIGDVINGLGKTLGGIIDFITGVFTGDWKKAWDGIKSIFKGIWDALVAIVKTPINLIIDLINGLVGGVISGLNLVIRALNKISFDIPDWVPVLGGKTFGFNIKELTAPKIPKLATGTVVPANYGEFLAILGDNKREAEVVSPISAMKQAFKEAMTEMGGAGTGTINLNVYLEGKQIHSEVVRQDKQYKKETGKSAFAY
jgi:phage-related protein